MLRRSFLDLHTSVSSWIRCTHSLPATNWNIPRFRSSVLEDKRGSNKRTPSTASSSKTSKNSPNSNGHQPTPAEFLAHKRTLKARFPEGWNPPRKISRDAMAGLRSLHAHDPTTFSTPVLAEKFQISPEAVRRILRSKWEPKREERSKMLEKERRRKQEYIERRIERERAEVEEMEERRKAIEVEEEPVPRGRWEKEDRLTLR